SWKLGGAWLPTAMWRVHATVGTAYRAPSLDERFADYITPFDVFLANPDLEVQRGLGWDVGIGARLLEAGTIDFTVFGTHYRERIVSVFTPDFTFGTLVNESSS